MLYCLVNLWALKLFFARNSFLVGHKADVVPLFDHINLFQALLHHCFVCLLKHLAAILGREEVYSLEFQSTTSRRNLSNIFWEGRELVTMTIAHCSCDVPVMESTILLCSQLLSAVSGEPRVIFVVAVAVWSLSKRWIKPHHRKLVSNIRLVSLQCLSRS